MVSVKRLKLKSLFFYDVSSSFMVANIIAAGSLHNR